MKRNLKALGLAVVAAFALSAVAAASASAQAQFTADQFPAIFTGHEEGETNYFEATPTGNRVECDIVTYEGTVTEPSSTITVFATYDECEAGGQNATVNMNGCHYVFHAGEATSTTDVHGTADIVCPGGGPIRVSIAGGICVVDIPAQNGLEGVTFTNEPANPEAETPTDFITVDVDITDQIKYTDTDAGGFFCPFAGNSTNNDGDFVSTVVIKGYTDVEGKEGSQQNIHVKNPIE